MLHLTRKGIIFFFLIDALLVGVAVSALIRRGGDSENGTGNMRITSTAFAHDETIPPVHACDGRDVSPPLAWDGAPSGTKSFVLIMDDPEAPTGTWTHWTVWDIPATSAGFELANVTPGAVQGVTSAGTKGWHGPCPPFGTHRYLFRLYALDVMLRLPPATTVTELEQAMEGHVLDKAGLVGRYAKLRP